MRDHSEQIKEGEIIKPDILSRLHSLPWLNISSSLKTGQHLVQSKLIMFVLLGCVKNLQACKCFCWLLVN